MKKMMAMMLAVLLFCGSFGMTVSAEETVQTAQVYVTIADANGDLALVLEPITVTDVDGDSALTINDALYIAHEEKFKGGAATGYGSAFGDYGLSMTKLWGVANGGSYGYYVNNVSAYSLENPVENGDFINAFIYTMSDWSDVYSWFDVNTVESTDGEEITLTLSSAGYDAAWNPVTLPVADAVITVDGDDTAYTTDADGKVTLTLTEGTHIISAVSEAMVLVPPVCKVVVAADEISASTPDSPSTGNSVPVAALLTLAAALAVCGGMLAVRRSGAYEK